MRKDHSITMIVMGFCSPKCCISQSVMKAVYAVLITITKEERTENLVEDARQKSQPARGGSSIRSHHRDQLKRLDPSPPLMLCCICASPSLKDAMTAVDSANSARPDLGADVVAAAIVPIFPSPRGDASVSTVMARSGAIPVSALPHVLGSAASHASAAGKRASSVACMASMELCSGAKASAMSTFMTSALRSDPPPGGAMPGPVMALAVSRLAARRKTPLLLPVGNAGLRARSAAEP
mmetsp:Transcript_132415/g.369145  ORF Transcript_132415/g.369145 Transcript_132415/m.369145 type:complete len:238 (-) Transcript_132415:1-714(-)